MEVDPKMQQSRDIEEAKLKHPNLFQRFEQITYKVTTLDLEYYDIDA